MKLRTKEFITINGVVLILCWYSTIVIVMDMKKLFLFNLTIFVAVVHPLADPDQGLRLGILGLVLHVRRPLPGLAGHQLLQLGVEVQQVVRRTLRLHAVLPAHAHRLLVDLCQGVAPGNEAVVGLGVEPWSHGEARDWQLGWDIAKGEEVISQDLLDTGSLVGLVLQQLLDQVLGRRSNSAWDMILVLLDSVVGVLQMTKNTF